MSAEDEFDVPLSQDELVCARCNQTLTKGEVTVEYMGFSFPAQLLRCPTCGAAHIAEELANGQMLEVELMLEDK
jgi:hypothetical protein